MKSEMIEGPQAQRNFESAMETAFRELAQSEALRFVGLLTPEDRRASLCADQRLSANR
jgi:hypothetical protein